MPTYQFRCPNGHDFDKFERKISDKTKAKCPECGKMAERQVSGGLGFHLKGSGFYATDYKGGKSEGGKTEKTKSESKSEAKSESKPESKADSKPAKPKKDTE